MRKRGASFGFRAASFTVVLLWALCRPACGGVVIRVEPTLTETGPGGKFDLLCRLENPSAEPIVSYQIFIGYPADLIRVVSVTFPPDSPFGEEPFAAGSFDGRTDAAYAAWRDGVGIDVVSLSALAPGSSPITESGRIAVIHCEVVGSGAGEVRLQTDPGPYWSFSGVFRADGSSVPVTWSLGGVEVKAVPPVRDLDCIVAGGVVELSWREPVSAVDSLQVERNGEVLVQLDGTATAYTDENPSLGENSYRVIAVSGGELGAAAGCSVFIPLPGPSDLRCTFDGSVVQLNWTVPLTYAYQNVFRNEEFLARLPGDADSYVDEGPFEGESTFTYRIVGVRTGVESESATCEVEVGVGAEDFIRGDANSDGRLVLSDAVAILRYLFSGGSLICQDAADFDDNGRIQLADVIGLLGWLFGDGDPPPPPVGEPGPDPTPDNLSCFRGSPE